MAYCGYVVVDMHDAKDAEGGFQGRPKSLPLRILDVFRGIFDKFHILPMDWRALIKLFPLTGALALSAVASTYLLTFTPLIFHHLSASLSLLAVLPWTVLLGFRVTRIDLTLKPFICLWLFGMVSSIDPDVQVSWKTFSAVLTMAVTTAGWPVLVDWTWSDESNSANYTTYLDDDEDQPLAQRKAWLQKQREREMASQESGPDWRECWRILCHVSLLVTLILFPILWMSGEIGHMLRNCYFLGDTRFWSYMALGAVSRTLVLSCSILLIWEQSTYLGAPFGYDTVVFLAVVNMLWIKAMLASTAFVQLWGSVGFVFGAIWFQVCRVKSNPIYAIRAFIRAKFHSTGRRKCRRILIVLLGCLATASVLTIQLNSWKRIPVQIEHINYLPTDTPIPEGPGGFLGGRPPFDSNFDLVDLLRYCNSTSSASSCLGHMSTEWVAASLLAKPESLDSHPLQNPSTIAGPPHFLKCPGQLLNYHILLSGPPSLRHLLQLKSFLHTQNLACSHLTIWSTSIDIFKYGSERSHSPLLMQFGQLVRRPYLRDRIEWKIWDMPARIPLIVNEKSLNKIDGLSQLAMGNQILRGKTKPSGGEERVRDGVVKDKSDGSEWWIMDGDWKAQFSEKALQRVMMWGILHLFGGIWLGGDGVVLLRDLRPLIGSNRPMMFRSHKKNDAPGIGFADSVVAMEANSTVSRVVISAAVNGGMNFHSEALGRVVEMHGLVTNDTMESSKMLLLSAALFESEQYTYSSDTDGEVPLTLRELSHGAFGYTLKDDTPDPLAQVVMLEHDAFFAGVRENPYGEIWTGPDVPRYPL